MSRSDLRPFQQEAIAWFMQLPRRRAILAHATGAGKTRTALEIAAHLGAKRLLVVASAMARPTWVREAQRWSTYQIHSIRFGKGNSSLTKAQRAERDAAYAAEAQVTSYALLKHLDASPRDLVIVDEAHALRDPNSQQSRQAKAFLHAYPEMPALVLTATPIPNEVVDIWNLVDSLYPGYLGDPTDTGEAPWSFRRAYCQCEEGWEGRKKFFGARVENLPRLAKKLAPIMHRVSSEEVALHTPALNTNIQWVDEPRVTDRQIAAEWLEAREAEGSTHVGLFCWLHKTAAELHAEARKQGWEAVHIDGTMSPEARQSALDKAQALPRCCVVGTAGSLAESVSLSFLKQGLIFEWRATPGQAVQFAGRFARQDSTSMAPTYLLYVARTDDTVDAERLQERLSAISSLYKQDDKAEQLREIMKPRPLDEELTQKIMDNAFRTARIGLASAMLEEDDDE